MIIIVNSNFYDFEDFSFLYPKILVIQSNNIVMIVIILTIVRH